MEKGTVILLVGLAGAGGFALAYSQRSTPSSTAAQPAQPAQQEDIEPQEMQQQQLPPNHPPLGNTGSMGNAMGMGASDDESAALEWKAPDAWKSVPNPNGMRLATY